MRRLHPARIGFVVVLVLAPFAAALALDVDRAKAPPPLAEAADSGTALAAARRQRTPVTVTGLTDETRLVQALPNGNLSAELTLRPVRAKRADRWVPVDTTLVRRADGSVVPRTATVDLAFSGGGERQPLVAIGAYALTWPAALPVPRLAGSTATYADVLPGIDLVLQAQADGYAKRFVVKDAAAAKHSALAGIQLGLQADGGAMQVNADGSTDLRDRSGKVVLTGPPSTMWDAAEPATGLATDASKRARVTVKVEGNAVTLVPDQTMLRDPTTRFPVVVDPGSHTPYRHSWAKVFLGYPNDEYWNGGGGDGSLAKVGRCPIDFPDSYCGSNGGIQTARSYFTFDTGFVGDRTVIKADFLITATNGTRCDDRWQSLYRAHAEANGALNWNNQPGHTWLSGAWVNGCGNRGAGWTTNGDLNPWGMTTYTLVGDEGDGLEAQRGWRRYDPGSARLYVVYNATPNVADAEAIYPPLPIRRGHRPLHSSFPRRRNGSPNDFPPRGRRELRSGQKPVYIAVPVPSAGWAGRNPVGPPWDTGGVIRWVRQVWTACWRSGRPGASRVSRF